jgi:hypothetical protein
MAAQVVAAMQNAQRYQAAQDRIRELHRALDEKRHGPQPTAPIWDSSESLAGDVLPALPDTQAEPHVLSQSGDA